MSRTEKCVWLLLFLLMVGLAGRMDMKKERPSAEVLQARADMTARAAEEKCGQQVPVKRRDGWACVPLQRSM